MYEFNIKPENWIIRDYTAGTCHKDDGTAVKQWGLGRAHRLVTLAYNLAFTCLLRFDEVLKIQSHDLILLSEPAHLMVTLPFRKTNQFGGVCVLKKSLLCQQCQVTDLLIRHKALCASFTSV